MLEGSDILFVGIGASSVLWYRVALPAIHLGADWVGVSGRPPNLRVVTGLVAGETQVPKFDDYRVVILQQVYGSAWHKQIRSLRERGIKVLYEIDDYIHGVPGQVDHDYAKYFTGERLAGHERCMREADGIICSTRYIAGRYARLNANVYVCPNGLDVKRYELTRPQRSMVNIGWAGATGHSAAVLPWLSALVPVMRSHPKLCFVSIGDPGYAAAVAQHMGPERALGIPFCPLECYPAAMCMFDIALAPAGETSWYRGKSDLRWLEASALGIPTIANPGVYPEIADGVTGFWAATPQQMAATVSILMSLPERRQEVGEAAREHVLARRTSQDAALVWSEVCQAAVGEYESMHTYKRGSHATAHTPQGA